MEQQIWFFWLTGITADTHQEIELPPGLADIQSLCGSQSLLGLMFKCLRKKTARSERSIIHNNHSDNSGAPSQCYEN